MQIYTIFRKIASPTPNFYSTPREKVEIRDQKLEIRNQKLEIRFEISKIQNLVDLLPR